jgi:hypothetical protein
MKVKVSSYSQTYFVHVHSSSKFCFFLIQLSIEKYVYSQTN